MMSDAIARTLWRIFVSRRHLLEWTPAAQATAGKRLDLGGFALRMTGALGIAAAALLVALLFGHGAWPIAAPFVALWLVSPAVARWSACRQRRESLAAISDAETQVSSPHRAADLALLRDLRDPGDNMAAARQFPGRPAPAIAHRTSPTNIGLYLLSVVSARDFGWIGATQAIERLEATLATMARMPRFRGHFFNWYDTRDLRVLDAQICVFRR